MVLAEGWRIHGELVGCTTMAHRAVEGIFGTLIKSQRFGEVCGHMTHCGGLSAIKQRLDIFAIKANI